MFRPEVHDPLDSVLCVEDLFYHTRLHRPITKKHLLFLLYFPIGVCVLVLRILFFVLSELLLFRLFAFLRLNSFFYKIYASALGVFIRVHGRENIDKNASIVVSNHTSEFDIIALRKFMPVAAISPRFYKTFAFTRRMIQEVKPLYVDYTDRSKIRSDVKQHLRTSSVPVLCFPEGALTNGDTGLLLYHKFLFSLGRPVQPLAARVVGPFCSVVNVHHLCTQVSHNIYWFLLCPWKVWHINVLPVQTIQPGETPERFAQRVQRLTAEKLMLIPSRFSVADKAVLMRRWYRIREGNRLFRGNAKRLERRASKIFEQHRLVSVPLDGPKSIGQAQSCVEAIHSPRATGSARLPPRPVSVTPPPAAAHPHRGEGDEEPRQRQELRIPGEAAEEGAPGVALAFKAHPPRLDLRTPHTS